MTNHQSERIGNYRIIEPLGQGGSANVYLVEDSNAQKWALKQIHADHAQYTVNQLQHFEREAKIQKGLKHDHIVKLHEANVRNGYIVIDYIEGAETLQTIVENYYPNGMDMNTIFSILEPLENALTYIHSKSLAHLDITPKNILLQPKANIPNDEMREWNIYLADFGLSRMLDNGGNAVGGPSVWRSGTPDFWAPEQADPSSGQKPGFFSDIYSLGLVIGFMWTGQQIVEQLRSVLYDSNHPPPGMKLLPVEIKGVLQRATHKDPKCRYANVQSLMEALEQARNAYDQTKIWNSSSNGKSSPDKPLTKPNREGSTKKLIKKIAAIGYSIVVTAVLLIMIVLIIIQNRSPTYPTRLGGLDFNTYCQTFGYNAVTANNAFCFSDTNLTAACNWTYPGQSSVVAVNQEKANPNTWVCYTHGNKLGGLSNLSGYCHFEYHYGTSVASPQENGSNGWLCEQKIDLTIVCIWQFNTTDIQARKNQGLWYCYGPS